MIHKEQFQEVIISTQDRTIFFDKVVELAAKGAVRKQGSIPRYGAPWGFRAEMILSIKSPEDVIKSGAHVHAIPPYYNTFTEQEMRAMTWDDFREACSLYNVKGKEREKMLKDYLNATKQA